MPEAENTKHTRAGLLFLYAETPMHPGTGVSLGVVDLPIQRERTTEYPIIQSSSVKGVFRGQAELRGKPAEELAVVFGPKTQNASDHAGALTFTDARILLFPVRTLRGVFTWVTSPGVLARLKRDQEIAGHKANWSVPKVEDGRALTSEACGCADNGKVCLEEYAFEEDNHIEERKKVGAIGKWMQDNAFPSAAEFEWWREKVARDLVILAEDDFRDFVATATEITARIGLDYETKTVRTEGGGALWYEEFLPSETLMYSVMIAQKPRKTGVNKLTDAASVIQWIQELKLDRVQIGGNETVGKGICGIRLLLEVK